MDAIYNAETETYQWSNTSDIQYANFFYQQPWPVGLRGHVHKNPHGSDENTNGTCEVPNEDQCVAFALPYRNNPMM